MFWQVLPWVVSVVTIVAMQLAGRKDPRGWLLGLANQGLWLLLIWQTQAWGLLLLLVALVWTYVQNYRRWTVSHD